MDSITLQNYRCFGSEEQTARLAPLTLLVGPNSTGKTSFLALIRALWDVAFREVVPNFREAPYDLGSFDEIVHSSGRRNVRASAFTAGFSCRVQERARNDRAGEIQFSSTFANRSLGPFPVKRGFGNGEVSLGIFSSTEHGPDILRYEIGQSEGQFQLGHGGPSRAFDVLPSFDSAMFRLRRGADREGLLSEQGVDSDHIRVLEQLRIDVTNHELFGRGRRRIGRPIRGRVLDHGATRPFAGAPLRSHPNRTYDPVQLAQDAQGEYIPSYLANLDRRNPREWTRLKGRLEQFGQSSGLFDEITVRPFGQSDGNPFQIQIRKFAKRRKGPQRNIIDVGYGVSQVLPILTELLREDAPRMFLVQQPEVHLHPQAQAALGTLFCQLAAGGRQLVVETHSDYIIDRVRMDVRDGKTDLKPEDVSILYFEPGDLDVKIHSIRLDEMGNVLDAPPGYRKFFMEEMRRSIGL